MAKDLWIDGEWYIRQRIFLIGYAYNEKKFGQLYGDTLTRTQFKKIVKPVTGYIYAYGPDVGMCEKFFGWKFRDKYICINLIKVFRDHIKTGSFKLAHLEELFGIHRSVRKYKTSIFQIWRDWKIPTRRYAVLKYNKEDVINLVKLTRIIFKKYKISRKYLLSVRLN